MPNRYPTPVVTAIARTPQPITRTMAGLGALGAKLGGAQMRPAMVRVMGWGVLAMAVTTGVGSLFGIHI